MTQINEQKSYKTDSCDLGKKYKSKNGEEWIIETLIVV